MNTEIKRITATMNAHGLKQMLYHIVKREPGKMCIYESAFDKIDISNIVLDIERGNENSTYFSDGKHTYHFSTSKNTLYMNFDDMELLDKFDVEIDEDPYALLASLMSKETKKRYSRFDDTVYSQYCAEKGAIVLEIVFH